MKIGTYGVICAQEAYTPVSSQVTYGLSDWVRCDQRLEFYLLVNYYFKYYEFLDTVFLALKKKPLSMSVFGRLGSV